MRSATDGKVKRTTSSEALPAGEHGAWDILLEK
jgi:hypothetical protein